ncbi:hypothetical protein [Streptomyces albipurpureus]|uniref:Secreted protein n=1 Tax=Streptomyces albipurpureus TaxID=2897419 RepID=A0ABT0UQ13_9ACTN|nr:hypothetical protein [Streptomyces sp. CWNU-1]MCM2390084.1 hypothetical protein [Streptomyces sp. CWNU-1]
MREAVHRALTWVLSLLLPATGRHGGPRGPQWERRVVDLGPWAKPWPTAAPRHVRDRHTPFRGDNIPAARPYVRFDHHTIQRGAVRLKPLRALVYAPHGLHLGGSPLSRPPWPPA